MDIEPISNDADTERLLRIVIWDLTRFFDYSAADAEEAVRSFYARWQSSRGDDFYHHEGAFRSASMIHYLATHRSTADFNGFVEWYRAQNFTDAEREALAYFRDNYFVHP